jgi:hypothetical protein
MTRGRNPRNARALDRRGGQKREAFKRILIVSEGTKSEPNYLKQIRIDNRIRTASVHIMDTNKGTDPLKLVAYAESLFLKGSPERNVAAREFDEVYVVFDYDSPNSFHAALRQIAALDKAHKNNDRQHVGFFAVASIPCFELWVLLHFENITHSLTLADALRKLLVWLPKYTKGYDNLYSDLRDNTHKAIARAKQLAEKNTVHTGPLPYTDFHKLVELLLSLAKA